MAVQGGVHKLVASWPFKVYIESLFRKPQYSTLQCLSTYLGLAIHLFCI